MRRIATALSLLLASTACTTVPSESGSMSAGEPMVSPILTGADAVDSMTYAQPQVARVTHVDLDLFQPLFPIFLQLVVPFHPPATLQFTGGRFADLVAYTLLFNYQMVHLFVGVHIYLLT